MRYKCYIEAEIRGLCSKEERKKYNQIIQKVFKSTSSGDCSDLTNRCIAHAVDGAEVHVILTDDQGIRDYNRRYREIDAPTDVLSFPVSSFAPGRIILNCDNINPENNYLSLGDVIISVERMRAQATELGHSQTREIAFLMCHSVLHLLGYDHIREDEAASMQNITEGILEKLGYTRDLED